MLNIFRLNNKCLERRPCLCFRVLLQVSNTCTWICVFNTDFELSLTFQLSLVFRIIPLPTEVIKSGEICAVSFLRLSRWTCQLYQRKENTKSLHGGNFTSYPTLYFKFLSTESRETINFSHYRLILSSLSEINDYVIVRWTVFFLVNIVVTSYLSKGRKVKYEFLLFSVSFFTFCIATVLERNFCIQ